jgi:hypothetical protein
MPHSPRRAGPGRMGRICLGHFREVGVSQGLGQVIVEKEEVKTSQSPNKEQRAHLNGIIPGGFYLQWCGAGKAQRMIQ